MPLQKATINKAVDILAHVASHIAEEKITRGDYNGASRLFSDSAKKYEYLAALRERDSALRTLARSLDLAKRAGDREMTYRLAMKLSEAILDVGRDIPRIRFDDRIIEHGEVVAGLPRVSEELSDSRCVYLYRIRVDKWSAEKLQERLDESELSKAILDSRSSVQAVTDDEEKIRIEFRYNAEKDVLAISSVHTRMDHRYVRDVINMLAASLSSIMRP